MQYFFAVRGIKLIRKASLVVRQNESGLRAGRRLGARGHLPKIALSGPRGQLPESAAPRRRTRSRRAPAQQLGSDHTSPV